MIWVPFGINAVLLIVLFMWFDGRQSARYNLFASWTQNSLMPQLGEIARSLEAIEAKEKE
jgi:hypothetical protein